jgi:hypothetical protein
VLRGRCNGVVLPHLDLVDTLRVEKYPNTHRRTPYALKAKVTNFTVG